MRRVGHTSGPGGVLRTISYLAAIAAFGFVALLGVGPLVVAPAFAATGTCSGLSYAGCSLAGVDFSGQNLQGADFAGADLTGANFAGANLQGADFTGADLEGANLSNVNLQKATLANADFSGANLQGANLQHVNAPNTNFNNADLTDAHLQQGVFTGCTDVNATLTGINLAQAVDFCSGTPSTLVPSVSCISKHTDDSFVAYFGYTNSGPAVTDPIGSTNSITPTSLNGAQPASFASGTVANAFSVTVPASGTAQWSVDGVSATATTWSPACTDNTLPADPQGMSLLLAVGGGGLVGVIVVRRTARGRRVGRVA